MTLTGIKKHVGVLEQAGLVTTEKVASRHPRREPGTIMKSSILRRPRGSEANQSDVRTICSDAIS
jgi:hypothetical protein